jgi:glycosyltransferase involved in cell wall biosynthesis
MNSDLKPLVSIAINNYNYERFLKEAIDSALNQTYPNVEVIVVDDGSKDNSREIITSYGNKIIPVLKKNGGQASAFNAGFEASRGEIIFFLDADDTFYPHKVSKIVDLFARVTPKARDVTIFNYLKAVDENGSPLEIDKNSRCELPDFNKRRARNKPKDGELYIISTSTEVYDHARKYRYIPFLGLSTSSLAMTRSLAEQIFPLPCEGVRISADDFLVKAAALLGDVYSTDNILSEYRIHGSNNWYGQKSIKSEVFCHELDEFLNYKLKSNKKKSVLSYFDSLHSQYYYKARYGEWNCSKELFELSIKALLWHIDLRTIKFFFKTLFTVIYSYVGRKNASREVKDRGV